MLIGQLHNGRPATSEHFYFRWLFEQSMVSISIGQLTNVIENIADASGGEWCGAKPPYDGGRITFSKMTNFEAAHGRIMDVDVAPQSPSRLAKHNVLVQSSAAMVAQANNLTAIALTLLTG